MSSTHWISWDEEPVYSSDDDGDEYICSDQDDDELTKREESKAFSIERKNPITPLNGRKIRKIFTDYLNGEDEDEENQENRRKYVFTPAKNGKVYINAPYTPAPLKQKQMHKLEQLPWYKNNPNYRPIASEKLIIDEDFESFGTPYEEDYSFLDNDDKYVFTPPVKTSSTRRKSVTFQDQCEIITPSQQYNDLDFYGGVDDEQYPDEIKGVSKRLFCDDDDHNEPVYDHGADIFPQDDLVSTMDDPKDRDFVDFVPKRKVNTRRKVKSKVVKLNKKIKGSSNRKKTVLTDVQTESNVTINKFLKKRTGKSAFQLFVADNINEVRSHSSGATYSQLLYHLTNVWNGLSSDEKDKYLLKEMRQLNDFNGVNKCTNVY